MSKKTVWHRGPPPSIGWWPTKSETDKSGIRWWNGRRWGVFCSEQDTPESAQFWSRMPSFAKDIRWTDRPASWPARSRT